MIKTKHLKRTKTQQTDYHYYYVNAVSCPLHASALYRPSRRFMMYQSIPPISPSMSSRPGGERQRAERKQENPNVFHETQSCARLLCFPTSSAAVWKTGKAPHKNRENAGSSRRRRETPSESHLIRRSQRAHSITKRRLPRRRGAAQDRPLLVILVPQPQNLSGTFWHNSALNWMGSITRTLFSLSKSLINRFPHNIIELLKGRRNHNSCQNVLLVVKAEDQACPPPSLTQAIPAVKHYRDRRTKTHFQQQRTAKKSGDLWGGGEQKKQYRNLTTAKSHPRLATKHL